IFEWINARTANWEYLGSATLTQFEYYLLCTLSFSTVMPAVFESAELVRSFAWIERFGRGPRVSAAIAVTASLFVSGVALLTLTLIWPRFFYPFVWVSLVLILEPINCWLGRQNLLQRLHTGDWRAVVALSLGALLCGFFWEMWNFYSYPKW